MFMRCILIKKRAILTNGSITGNRWMRLCIKVFIAS